MDPIGIWCKGEKPFIFPMGKLPGNDRQIVERINVLRIGCQNFLKPFKRLLEFPPGKVGPRKNDANGSIA
jgi:hypothetical protein